MGEIVEGNDLP